MPIYEYRCEACGHIFEKIQSFSAAPPQACPKCEGGPVEKAVSKTSFILKGGGWYKDGYTGPSNGTPSSSSSSSTGSSSSTSSDSSSSTSSDSSSSTSSDSSSTGGSSSDSE